MLQDSDESEVLSTDDEVILEQLRRVNFEISSNMATYSAEYLTTNYISNLFKELIEGDSSAYKIFQDAKSITERYHQSMDEIPPPELPGDETNDDNGNGGLSGTGENISTESLVKIATFIAEFSVSNKISIDSLLNNQEFLNYIKQNLSNIIVSKDQIDVINSMSDSELQAVLLSYINSTKTDDNIVDDSQTNQYDYEVEKKLINGFIEYLEKNYLINLSVEDKNTFIEKLLVGIEEYYKKMSYYDISNIKSIFLELHDNNYFQESNNYVNVFNKFFIENMSIEKNVSVEQLLLGNEFDNHIKEAVDNLYKYLNSFYKG